MDGAFEDSTSTDLGSRPVGLPDDVASSEVVVCEGESRRESAGGLSSLDVGVKFDGPGTDEDA